MSKRMATRKAKLHSDPGHRELDGKVCDLPNEPLHSRLSHQSLPILKITYAISYNDLLRITKEKAFKRHGFTPPDRDIADLEQLHVGVTNDPDPIPLYAYAPGVIPLDAQKNIMEIFSRLHAQQPFLPKRDGKSRVPPGAYSESGSVIGVKEFGMGWHGTHARVDFFFPSCNLSFSDPYSPLFEKGANHGCRPD